MRNALLAVVAALLPGCATLAPYQRAALMTAAMQEPRSPLEAAADEHVWVTRESQRGATRAGGASCGCN